MGEAEQFTQLSRHRNWIELLRGFVCAAGSILHNIASRLAETPEGVRVYMPLKRVILLQSLQCPLLTLSLILDARQIVWLGLRTPNFASSLVTVFANFPFFRAARCAGHRIFDLNLHQSSTWCVNS